MNSNVLLATWALAAAAMAAPGVATAQASAADAGALVELISLQTASDRMNAELDQVVRAAVARGAAERSSMSASRPIQSYLEDLEATVMAVESPNAGSSAPPLEPVDIPPLIEKHLLLMEEIESGVVAQDAAARGEVETYAGAKSKGVAVKLRTAAAIEAWGRLVVIVPPGEVIENDPIDVAHARLEDLTRRREELQAELKTKPTSLAMRSILLELAGIDRQINTAIFQITGVVWFHRAGKGSICHPPAVKGRPVAWYNCDYWALNMPFVVDPGGANIIVDRVLVDVDEDASGLRSARVAYYTRARGQPPSEEPNGGAFGEFRYMANGTVQLVVREVDDAGEERERLYPWEVATDELKGLIPGFSNHGPFKLKFKRDPKAYISWEEAQAIAKGTTPKRPSDWTDDDLIPLTPPAPTPPGDSEVELLPLTSPPAPAADDDGLIPLVPGPQTGTPEVELVPLTSSAEPPAPDADGLVPLVPPN